MVQPLSHDPVSRGVQVAALVVVAVVLASHLFFVTGLASSGVTWRGDPDEAYGVAGNQALDGLPRWVTTPVFLVMFLSVLLGPFFVLVGLLAALATTWTTWRAEHRLARLEQGLLGDEVGDPASQRLRRAHPRPARTGA